MACKLEYIAFRRGKDPYHVRGKQLRDQENEQGHDHHDADGDPEKILQLWDVLPSVVVADHGGNAGRKSHEHRGHQELGVQHHRDGGHARFPSVLEHENVKKEGGDRNSNVVHHLRRAVGAAVKQDLFPENRLDDIQGPFSVEGEIQQAHQSRHRVSHCCGHGCPGDSHVEDGDKDVVEHNVDTSADHRGGQSQIRFSRCDKKGLKKHLENGQGSGQDQNEKIVVTVVVQAGSGAQQHDELLNEKRPQHQECHSEQESHQQDQGKILFGLLVLLLAHVLGDDGAATCGQHDGDCHDNAGHRVHDV